MTGRVKKRIALLVGAVVLLGASVAGAYAIKQAHVKSRMAESLRDGMAAYEAGDYQGTMDKLGYYASHDKNNVQVILALADARRRTPLENRRHIAEAIRFARLAAELAPSDPAPLAMLLDLYGEAGFIAERLQAADALLAIKKDDREAMEAKVACLAQLGKIEESLATANALAKAHPDDLTAHAQVVELMVRLHTDPKELRDYADNAAKDFPDDPRFIVMQARVHAQTGDAGMAIDLANKASTMPFKSSDGVADLLLLLDMLSRADPAMARAADKVLEREVSGPLARDIAAVAAERSWKIGHPDAARTAAAKAIDAANPASSPDAALGWWTFLGVASGKPLDDAEIKAAVKQLQSRKGTAAAYWIDLIEGAADLNAGRLRDAEQHFARAEAADYKNDIPEFLLGDVDQRLGEWRHAASRWEAVARSQPSWRVIHVSLVSLLLQHGQPDEAVVQAEFALSVRPGLAEATTLCRAMAMQVETGHANPETLQRALTVAETVDQQSKNDWVVQALVARIYLAAGQPDKGLQIVRTLMGVTPGPSPDALAALAIAVRPHDPALAEQVLAMARAGGETPDMDFQAANQLALAGRVNEGRTLLQRAVETHKDGPASTAYDLRLASYLDRIKDAGAGAAFARLSAQHENEPVVQLTVLDSDAAWKDEALISACIGRLRHLTGDGAVAWKINEGRRLLAFSPSQSRAAQAVQLLSEAVRQDPNNVGALVLTAEAHAVLGDRNKAIELLAKAVDAEPDRASFYPRLIELLQQAGAAEEASRRLLVFSKIPNLPPDVQRRRGRLLAAQGMWDQAFDDFSQLAAGGSVEDRFALGVVLSRRGDASGARRELDGVLQSPGLTEPIVVSIADLYAGQGDIDLGREVIEQHLPPDAAPHRGATLAAYLERFNRFAPAEEQYVLQAKDGKPDSLAELAKFYYKRGRIDDAKAVVDKGLAVAPDNGELKQMDGFIKLSKGSNKEALRDIAGSLDSLNASAQTKELTKALQEFEENPKDLAGYIAKLEEITKNSPDFFPAWRLLVGARYQRGEVNEAIDAARQAARSSPIDPRPAKLATEIMVAAGRLDEALLAAQQWRQRSVTEPFDADMTIANINDALKRFSDGLKQAEPWKSRILAEADTAPDHLALYADLLANTGRAPEAQDLVWPRAEKDPTWALRCLKTIPGLPGPLQEAWLAKLQPLLDKSPAGRMAIGRILFQLASNNPSKENYERVITMLKGALDDNANRGDAALLLAAASQAQSDKPESIRYYRIAIEANPADSAALNNLAYVLAEDTSTASEAAAMAQKAVDLAETQGASNENRKSFLDTLGVALLKCGRFHEAEEAFRKAQALDPAAFELAVGLAEATLGQGQAEQARLLIRQVDEQVTGAAKDPSLDTRVAAIRKRLQDFK